MGTRNLNLALFSWAMSLTLSLAGCGAESRGTDGGSPGPEDIDAAQTDDTAHMEMHSDGSDLEDLGGTEADLGETEADGFDANDTLLPPAPSLVAEPASLDFGWVALGQTKSLELTLRNVSDADVKITDVTFGEGSNLDLTLDDQTYPLTLESGTLHVFKVSFSPTSPFGPTTEAIATLHVASAGAASQPFSVPVYGNLDEPFIMLDPADKVDFHIVAQDWTIERTVTVTNMGHAPLLLSSVAIEANTPDQEFAWVPGTEANSEFLDTATLQSGQSIVVRLAFTNKGPAAGVAKGVCAFASNDPVMPQVLLDMEAYRGGLPECKLTFVPAKLEFGTVAHGSTKTMTLFVKNKGSGYCTWKSAVIRDCISFMGQMTQCTEAAGPSSMFTIVAAPVAVVDGIAPGDSVPLEVLFTPPTVVPMNPTLDVYNAWLQITYEEEYSTGSFVSHNLPIPNANGEVNANISGASGVADIAVVASQIDFGPVTVGCHSLPRILTFHNAGTAALQIWDIHLDGCSSEVALVGLPALTDPVEPFSFGEVSLVYSPLDVGADECYLVIESSDMDTPSLKVHLTGLGTSESVWTEYFTQADAQKVDILFVIDESASMCDEQKRLSDNISAFVARAEAWGYDYQLGITTTNIDGDNEAAGHLLGTTQRFLTGETVGLFADLVDAIGCEGAGKQEAGLEASRQALSYPLSADTQLPCACAEDQPCPGFCPSELSCVQGFCGGYNRGFLRPEASLEVVIMSDEEDQSNASVPFYLSVFKSIKSAWDPSRVRIHAIVGDQGEGCNGNGSDGNIGADAGDRYIAVQQETGGLFASICDDTFASMLQHVGETALGLKHRFILGAQVSPVAGALHVWVDNGLGLQPCTDGWTFLPETNSILFEDSSPCMPQVGATLKVTYDMACGEG